MWGNENGSILPKANKYLYASILLFVNGEGDEATSPSFKTRCARIHAFSALLEVLIASLLPASGTTKEATFPTAIKLWIAIRPLFA